VGGLEEERSGAVDDAGERIALVRALEERLDRGKIACVDGFNRNPEVVRRRIWWVGATSGEANVEAGGEEA
jgi:hypothetical protein